jgi:hypothetical protein
MRPYVDAHSPSPTRPQPAGQNGAGPRRWPQQSLRISGAGPLGGWPAAPSGPTWGRDISR